MCVRQEHNNSLSLRRRLRFQYLIHGLCMCSWAYKCRCSFECVYATSRLSLKFDFSSAAETIETDVERQKNNRERDTDSDRQTEIKKNIVRKRDRMFGILAEESAPNTKETSSNIHLMWTLLALPSSQRQRERDCRP